MIYLRKYISRIGTVDNNENENKIYYPIHLTCSQTCIKRSLLGPRKSDLIRQVIS